MEAQTSTVNPIPPASRFPSIAIYWVPEAYTLDGGVIVGRRSAGASFIKAVAAARPQQLFCYAKSREEVQAFTRVIRASGGSDIAVHWIPFTHPEGLPQAGLLYRPGPSIGFDAWRRAAKGDGRAFSICGVTHSLTTHTAKEAIASLLTAPLHSWDALVCTSKAARDSVQAVLDAAGEHLRDRLGATRLPLPRTPVIPLGVDCGAYAFGEGDRAAARRALGIEPDEAVVSYVGRLNFIGKAHPVPMYVALEQAARGHRVVLLHVGRFPSRSVETAFKEESRSLCPSVRCIFVDGGNRDAVEKSWAATDVFTSLADSFQESFGLTPIEAMAAGIPSVVSDWNGYRDTVRDGVDGFRVPTLSMPPGAGRDIADRYDQGIDGYDLYLFKASQQVAVDVDAAAGAYRKLISDRELRARMGAAARARAVANFDWRGVIASYAALFEELAELRRDDRASPAEYRPHQRPERTDPFTMFATYPTSVLGPASVFQRRRVSVDQALTRLELNSTGKSDAEASSVRPSAALVAEILALFQDDEWLSIEEIMKACPGDADVIARAVVWLSKFGVLRFDPSARNRVSDQANGYR